MIMVIIVDINSKVIYCGLEKAVSFQVGYSGTQHIFKSHCYGHVTFKGQT